MMITTLAKKFVKDKAGISYPFVAVIILIIAIIFAFVLEYASVYTLAQNSKKMIGMELDNYNVLNSVETFKALINQENTAEEDCTEMFLINLSEKLSLVKKSSYEWYNPNDPNNTIYVFDKQMYVTTTKDNVLILELEYTVILRFKVGNIASTDINIPMTVKSSYQVIYK